MEEGLCGLRPRDIGDGLPVKKRVVNPAIAGPTPRGSMSQ